MFPLRSRHLLKSGRTRHLRPSASIAIPHSVHMDAYQTKIGVAVSRSGIAWGNNLVNVMLLIAINKYDKQILLTINESILSLFENPIFSAG